MKRDWVKGIKIQIEGISSNFLKHSMVTII
jgi:hypothetical protein